MFQIHNATVRNAENPNNPFRTIYVHNKEGEHIFTTSLNKIECIKTGLYFIWKGLFPNKAKKEYRKSV